MNHPSPGPADHQVSRAFARAIGLSLFSVGLLLAVPSLSAEPAARGNDSQTKVIK